MKTNPKQSLKEIPESERKFVEEITSPIRPYLLKILLSLFILLPLVYVLVREKPGAWLPEQDSAIADINNKTVQTKSIEENPFAKLDSLIIKASNQPNYENYFNLSFEFYQVKKFKEAITAAEKALEFNPRSAKAYNNICSSYNELKEYSKAIEACKKALEIEPQLQIARNNLKWAEEQIKKH